MPVGRYKTAARGWCHSVACLTAALPCATFPGANLAATGRLVDTSSADPPRRTAGDILRLERRAENPKDVACFPCGSMNLRLPAGLAEWLERIGNSAAIKKKKKTSSRGSITGALIAPFAFLGPK